MLLTSFWPIIYFKLRGYLHETGMNSDQYELVPAVRNFCSRLPLWPCRNAWSITWDRYELKNSRSWSHVNTPLVQRPRRSQTGLSLFSDRSHVNARKEMYGGRYELIPVSCKYPLRNKQKSRKSSIKQQDEVQTQTELSGLTEVPFFDDVIWILSLVLSSLV